MPRKYSAHPCRSRYGLDGKGNHKRIWLKSSAHEGICAKMPTLLKPKSANRKNPENVLPPLSTPQQRHIRNSSASRSSNPECYPFPPNRLQNKRLTVP